MHVWVLPVPAGDAVADIFPNEEFKKAVSAQTVPLVQLVNKPAKLKMFAESRNPVRRRPSARATEVGGDVFDRIHTIGTAMDLTTLKSQFH